MLGSSKSVFTPSHVRDTQENEITPRSIKIYGRFVSMNDSSPPLMIFEDGTSKIHVDYSFIESISCEKGEWYRLLGEVRHGINRSTPVLSLNLAPVLISDHDSGLYEDLLDVREDFIFNFENLLAYACKHK